MRSVSVLAGVALLLGACSPPAPKEVTTDSLRQELLAYRSVDEVCTSDSTDCRQWIEMALKCEHNLEKMIAGNACTQAEEFREQVTGIELSSKPGAYDF